MPAPILDNGKHVITDHYVCRWLERVKGIDLDALRGHIWAEMQEPSREIIKSGMTVSIRHKGGLKTIADDGKLITILEPKQRSKNKRPKLEFEE